MKFHLLALMLILPLIIFSQNNQGIIEFDETIQMEIELPEEFQEQLEGVIPSSQATKKKLVFNDRESLYLNEESNEDNVMEAGSEESAVQIKMIIATPDNKYYKNLKENQVFEKQEFFGRDFLIYGELDSLKWKLISEQKEILGFTCLKAMIEKDDDQIIAWYTPQIPVSNGPAHYGQLPGMILEIVADDGKHQIIASHIDLETLEEGAIEKPKKGKKVTRKEFEEIMAEKEKEMEQEFGKGENKVIIRTIGH